jgi:hypothetical protein
MRKLRRRGKCSVYYNEEVETSVLVFYIKSGRAWVSEGILLCPPGMCAVVRWAVLLFSKQYINIQMS